MATRKPKELSTQERFCIDGYLVSHDAETAYRLQRTDTTPTANADSVHRMALRWLRSPQVQTYMQMRKQELSNVLASDVDEDNRTRGDVIRELNLLINKTTDGKLRAQMLMQLADLMAYKQNPHAETEQSESHVQYYLPLTCEKCALYVEYGKFLKERKLPPSTEMEWGAINAAIRANLEKRLNGTEPHGKPMRDKE